MTGRPGTGKTPRQAPGAVSPGSGRDARATMRRPALPADLDRSLRLLDDVELDRLAKAVTEEVRRRRYTAPDSRPATGRPAGRAPAEAPRARPGEPDKAAAVTPGQERLILAALEAGVRAAAIAKEVRLPRSTVQQVIADAKRARQKTAP